MTTNKHGSPEPIDRQTDDFICAAYLRIPDQKAYQGEYGFDWLEIEPKDGKVKEIQGVSYDKVTHYFKLANENYGNVIKRTSENDFEVQQKIKEEYPKFLNVEGRYVDIAQVLLKKGQEVKFDLYIKCLMGELNDSEVIEIKSNEHYKFKLEEHEEFQRTLSIPLGKENDIFKLIIRCDDYTLTKEGEHFHIYLRRKDKASIPIGCFVMMQNKPLILTFRVIALVSKDGKENVKVRSLFDDFKNNKVKDFLNNNSLNQAGYEVVIENEMTIENSEADLDEYLYAFDKNKWIDEKYFLENQPYDVRYYKQDENGKYIYENERLILVTETKYADVLDAKDLDSITVCAYRKKLQNTEKYKDYIGGLIILTEYRSKENAISAFSKVKPLNHYLVFVYATNDNDVDTFAHEIGHMLGLPHSFADSEAIQFSSLQELEKKQYKLNFKMRQFEKGINSICCPKDDLRKALENYNKQKNAVAEKINTNKMAISLIDELMPGDYYEFKPTLLKFYMLQNDYTTLYDNYFKYLDSLAEQRKKHFLYFEQMITQNKMDYYNYGGKFYTSYQIEIMREDYGNY